MVNIIMEEKNKTQLITQFQTIIIIPNYPDEIAIEILSRLPHKSLFKFKSVCKTWQSLFSDPSFIKLHKKNHNEALLICSPQHHTVFLLHVKNPKTPLNLDYPFRNYLAPVMTLVGSINGLICLSNSPPWPQSFVIWNPETNQYKCLPRHNNAYLLGTDFNKSLGFCYHSPTSDYIVVRIARCGERSKVKLYSLNSNSWRNIENVLDYSILFETCNTIVKGKPYWWAGPENSRFLVGFDISDNNMLFTEVPTFKYEYDDRFEKCKLANYNGLLTVLVDSTLSLLSLNSKYLGLGDSPEHKFSERFINMLVLGDDGSWSVRLRVGFPREMERVIGCSMNGRIVLKHKSGMIVLFDTENEKIESTNIVEAAYDKSFVVSN